MVVNGMTRQSGNPGKRLVTPRPHLAGLGLLALAACASPVPDSGVGFLAGYRGVNGDKALVGEPNPDQWEMYEKNNCVFH